jgi:hypothetical protein
MKVEKVTVAEDRQGRPQWELSVRWEWTPASNQWGERIWVYQQICPQVINMGAHNVLVERGTVKTNRDGVSYDGSYDWMWHWKLSEWEGKGDTANMADDISPQLAAETPAPAPVPAPVARAIDENQMRIMRQATLKCASWIMVPLMKDFSNPLMAVQRTEELSEMFMEYVISGKVIEDGSNESNHSGEIDEEF